MSEHCERPSSRIDRESVHRRPGDRVSVGSVPGVTRSPWLVRPIPAFAVGLVAVLALLVGVLPMPIGSRSAAAGTAANSSAETAVSATEIGSTARWLAGLVGPDGAVDGDNGEPSIGRTMSVAQALASVGLERAALARAMDYIGRHVESWVISSNAFDGPIGSYLPGESGALILLVHTTGGDPRAFGEPTTDLVARLEAIYAVTEVGYYGTPMPYSSVQDHVFAVTALHTVGATVPTAAVDWLLERQCTAPAAAAGGWMAYRPVTAGTLDPCVAPDPDLYEGADTNATSSAIQVLRALGAGDDAVGDALGFLEAAQSGSTAPIGGFPWFPGGSPDPNSTALVLQAMGAAGLSADAWSVGGEDPLSALMSWYIGSGTDLGAFASPWSGGEADFIATSQALWGMAMVAFPFPVLPPWSPDSGDPEVTPTFAG